MHFSLPRREQLKQFTWTGFLVTVWFILVYGYTNYRADLGQRSFEFYHDWELGIPLIPWMILPYLSLNLLTLAPLFYLSPPEMRRLGRGLFAATVCAGFIFYVFPAPIGFLRPDEVPGWNALYQFLWSLDRTNNTLPSLHITFSLLTVLAVWPKTHTPEKIVLGLWMALICAAVLFTWQHHVWDVISGLILGGLTHKFIGEPPPESGFSWEL